MASLMKEFKDFAMKGNVIDMAVGVVIGGAFGKIITSLVNDLIMPLVGALIGNVDFTTLSATLRAPKLDEAGEVVKQAVTLNYGNFIQVTVDFLLVGDQGYQQGQGSVREEEGRRGSCSPCTEAG